MDKKKMVILLGIKRKAASACWKQTTQQWSEP